MNKFMALTRVLVKNNYGKLASSKKALMQSIALCLCMLPLMFLVYSQLSSFFDLGMTQAGIEFGLLLICGATVLTVFFSFPSMLYFSDDTVRLMAMPLPAWSIVWAKTVMIFLSAAAINLTIALPFVLSVLLSGQIDLIGVMLLLISILAILGSVLFILGTAFILIMKIMPKGLNKNSYNMISSAIAIVLALGLSIGMQSMAGQSESMNMIDPAAFSLPTGPFFQISLAARGIAGHDGLAFALCIAFCILCGLIYHYAAHKFYLRTAAAVSSAAVGQRKSRGRITYKKNSAFVEMMKVDIRELLRTPAYLMNAVLGSFIGPVIITLMMVFVPSFKELKALIGDFSLDGHPVMAWGFIAGCCFTLFMGGSNTIATTAVSRKGINGVKFMKSIPMKISDQLMSSCLVGYLFTVLGSMLYLVPVKMMISTPVSFDLFFLAGVLLLSWLVNITELLLDIIHPKLIWDNETALMKNNYNSIITLFGLWIYLGLAIVVLLFVFDGNFNLFAWVYGFFTLILCILFTWLMPKTADSHLKTSPDSCF